MRSRSPLSTVQLGTGCYPWATGGLCRYYQDLVAHLPAAQVQPFGLVTGPARIIDDSERVLTSFAPTDAPLWARLTGVRAAAKRLLRERAPALIASHFALYALPLLDLFEDRPLVIHFHGPWAGESSIEGARAPAVWLKAAIERWVYRRGARFIVLSSAFRDLLQATYGVAPERIRVVPGGVDVERFAIADTRRAARERLGWPTDRPILLTVRRLAARMGIDRLIEAVALLRARVPDVLLLIAGRGALEQRLRALIEQRALSEHVRLIGFVDEPALPFAYRAADLTVVPTVALEGFGLAIVESLAAGTPVLATPVGGIAEVLKPLSSDLVTSGCSARDLSDALLAILLGRRPPPDSAHCQEYARARFAWPTIAQRVADVYREAAAATLQ